MFENKQKHDSNIKCYIEEINSYKQNLSQSD